MGIKLGDNINITAGLPNDCRYQNGAVGPYSSVSQANSIVTSDIRYTGLTVNIGGTEYWYKEGILDGDLVEKTTAGGSGDVSKVGAPAVCQVAVWTGDGTICGGNTLKMSTNELCVTGSICATSALRGSFISTVNDVNVGGSVALNSTKCVVLDANGEEWATILNDEQGTIHNQGANTFILSTAGDKFAFVEGETSDLACIKTAHITAYTTNIISGCDLNLVAAAGSCDAGDLVFRTGNTLSNEWGRLWIDTNGCFNFRSSPDGLVNRTVIHSGNISSQSVASATNATTANNALCLGGSAASTYVQNLGDLGITATASEINTVADGTTAKNSHTHDDRYYTETESNTNYVSKTDNGTNSFSGGNLVFSNGGSSNIDHISYDDTLNIYYFNADTTLGNTAATGCVKATCFYGDLSGTATNATIANNATCLNGLTAGNYLRSNADDNLTAAIVVPTANRDEGIFGTYDSNKTQHIWSMGTAYRNAADGSSFGNLYGLAYKYNGDAGGHGVYLVNNGTALAGLGTNIWTSGNVIGTCFCGKAYDSDRLDNISSTSFLRSDTADIKTGGDLTFNDNISARFGTGGDLSIFHNGSSAYISNITGNLLFRVASTEVAISAIPNDYVGLYHNNVVKFKTCSYGGYIYGTGCATDWVASSDCRLKKCINPISNALSTITQLCGVQYNWCDNNCEDIGLIAQDVEKIMPVLVTHGEPTKEQIEKYNIDDNDVRALKYDKISALLIEAIKEQNETIKTLEKRLKLLENEKGI